MNDFKFECKIINNSGNDLETSSQASKQCYSETIIHRPTRPVIDMAIWVNWRATSEAKNTCRSAPMGLTTNHLLPDEATHKSCLWKSPQTPGGTGTLTFKLYFIWKQKNTPSNIPLTMPSAYGSDFARRRKSSSSWTTLTLIMLCHYGIFAVFLYRAASLN